MCSRLQIVSDRPSTPGTGSLPGCGLGGLRIWSAPTHHAGDKGLLQTQGQGGEGELRLQRFAVITTATLC